MITEQLIALAERCEQAEGPDRELDLAIARFRGVTVLLRNRDDTANEEHTYWQYTSNIDHALTLVPEGWGWSMRTPCGHAELEAINANLTCVASLYHAAQAPVTVAAGTPVLALCAAALKAMNQGGE